MMNFFQSIQIKNFLPAWFNKNNKPENLQYYVQILHETEMFDEDFYSEQVKTHIGSIEEIMDPAAHYLQFGVSQGLDPSDRFNTSWYLDRYSDVAQSGVNPVVHYVLHGEDEGRSPCPDQHSAIGFSSPNVCHRKLWGGFSNYALPKLEVLSNDSRKSNRLQSLWHLARWHYVHAEVDKSLTKIRTLKSLQKHLSKKLVVGEAKCLFALEQMTEYSNFVERDDVKEFAGQALPFLLANSELLYGQNEAGWLSNVNAVFRAYDLAQIQKKEAGDSLSLDNLSVENEPEHGLSGASPKVSVIVPAFNAAGTIHIALESLVKQTWPNLEIIVVDDASIDGTEEAVQDYCQRYDWVKYYCNAENMGAYPTRNHGFAKTTGEFITVHDSDDWSHPQKIEKQVEVLLEDASKVASVTNWVRINDKLGFVGPWLLCEDFVEKNHSSALIRREAIEKYGVWDQVNVGADTEFLWRLEKAYGSDAIVSVLPKVPFSFALAMESSLTKTKATHVKTIHYGLRRMYREAAAWWHGKHSNHLYLDPSLRAFPCPLGNQRNTPEAFGVMIAADFSGANERLDTLIEYVRNQAVSRSVVLFHWPDYRQFENSQVADETFDLCMSSGLTFTHSGHQVKAGEVHLFDADLLEWVPDSLPMVIEIKNAIVVSVGLQVYSSPRLKELFQTTL